MKIKPNKDIALNLMALNPETNKYSPTFIVFNFSKDKIYNMNKEKYGLSFNTQHGGKVRLAISDDEFNKSFKEVK